MTDIQELDRLPVVHIGMPKTATKTLQWRVFAEHSEIYYLGRYDGPSFRDAHREFEACRDEDVLRIMEPIAYKGIWRPDVAKCRKELVKYLASHNYEQRVPVWSWESYSTDSHRNRKLRADNLKSLFGKAKIIVTIRNPVALLESAFLQQLKRDNIGARYESGKPPFYCDIDDWLERDVGDDISNHLDYPRTIQMYVKRFGVENVCVLTYDQLVSNATSYFEQISDFMEINSDETLRLTSLGQNENSRWTMEQLERLKAIHRSLEQSDIFRHATRGGRKEMLNLEATGAPKVPGPKARAVISSAWQEQIQSRTRQGNQWLEQTFGLNLRELGYTN